MMNWSAKDEARSSLHYGDEGAHEKFSMLAHWAAKIVFKVRHCRRLNRKCLTFEVS